MNGDRYSTPPDPLKLEQSTAGLKASLDKLEASAASAPPPASLPSETEFFAVLRERLKLGQQTYGDKSFARDPGELLAELEQEALDLAGWGYVLWRRVRAARDAAERAGL